MQAILNKGKPTPDFSINARNFTFRSSPRIRLPPELTAFTRAHAYADDRKPASMPIEQSAATALSLAILNTPLPKGARMGVVDLEDAETTDLLADKLNAVDNLREIHGGQTVQLLVDELGATNALALLVYLGSIMPPETRSSDLNLMDAACLGPELLLDERITGEERRTGLDEKVSVLAGLFSTDGLKRFSKGWKETAEKLEELGQIRGVNSKRGKELLQSASNLYSCLGMYDEMKNVEALIKTPHKKA